MQDLFAGLESDLGDQDTLPVGTLEGAEIRNTNDAIRFMTAGNATVTLKSRRTGNRFTYRVRSSDDHKMLFVSLLNGPDNETNYQYLGHIAVRNMIFWHGRKSRITQEASSFKAFDWAWRHLSAGRACPDLEVWHEGRCGRCGRKLTVPESIRTGFGPECAERLGLG